MTRLPRTLNVTPAPFRTRRTAKDQSLTATSAVIPGRWRVVVADQSAACLYATDPAISFLRTVATMRNPAGRRMDRELLSSRSGNRFNRAGGRFQALAPHAGAHRASGEEFAKRIAAVAAHKLEPDQQLVLCAAPRLLALIERALPQTVCRDRLRTVARDVTHENAAQLRDRLRRALTRS